MKKFIIAKIKKIGSLFYRLYQKMQTVDNTMSFLFVWTTGFALFSLFELYLNLKANSVCYVENCYIVSYLSRIAHEGMVFLGLIYFSTFSLLSAFSLKNPDKFKTYFVLLGIAGISCELVFLLRQALDYDLFCPFCLTIAIGTLGASIPVLVKFKNTTFNLLHLCFAFLSIAFAFYITSVPVTPIWNSASTLFTPLGKKVQKIKEPQYLLIYSSNCPHCHEVIKFCLKNKINIKLCHQNKIPAFFRTFDLKGVPVLIAKTSNHSYQIIQGSNKIIKFLSQNLLQKNQKNLSQKMTKKTPEKTFEKTFSSEALPSLNALNALPKLQKLSLPKELQKMFQKQNEIHQKDMLNEKKEDSQKEDSICIINKKCE